ncbi:MAG: hypothetical protein WCI71_07250 [Bacteroidota bacterium]
MKKHLLILVFFLCLSGLTQAQNFYTRLGVGVSGGISSNLDLLYSYTNTGSGTMVTIVPVGFGRGFTGVAAFGYSPSKYFSMEFGISEFLGFPKYADSIMKLPGGSAAKALVQGNMLSLIPAIVLRPGFKTIDPYARIGFILGIRPTINATAEFTNASVNPAIESKAVRQYYGGVAAGLSAAIGVNWTINSVVSLYAEGFFNSINYSPRYSEVIFYEKNGVDQLSTLTVKQTKTEYYNNINPDEEIPETNPDKALRKSLPFSNAGIAFGILFHF